MSVEARGLEILEEWAREAGHDVNLVRRAQVAIDGDETRLASVSTAYKGRGFRVMRPDDNTGVHIQVRVGQERGGSWPTTEMVVLKADEAWEIPVVCGYDRRPEHTSYNIRVVRDEHEPILEPHIVRTPAELADRLARCL